MFRDVFAVCASVGWPQKVVCLYAPDYVPESTRLATTQHMWQVLSRALPSSEVRVPVVEGPFTDPMGIGAFFDGSKGRLTPAKMVLEFKKDFLTSMVTVLPAVERHRPMVLVGDGQGAHAERGVDPTGYATWNGEISLEPWTGAASKQCIWRCS